jgi:arylsulfatase A-like enzyme
VLFLAVDDLNDWPLEEDSPLHMPNFDRLARRGALFTRAYTASPACNPSRSAIMLGLSAATTGIYGNRSDWRGAFPDAVTLPQHFMAQGYRVEGAGKIFHHHDNSALHDDASFHRFQKMLLDPMPPRKFNGLYQITSLNFDWGPWPLDESETPDQRTVDYGIDFLQRKQERPFFLAIGIFRPHMPFHVPPKYFSYYPEERVVMPKMFDGDLGDIPSGGKALLAARAHFFKTVMAGVAERPGTWREAVRAYQASCTFADHQIGRLLDALARSPHGRNTIIVLWSDHGYHLGEKQHWEKFALWERTTRVPLVVVAPGVTAAGTRVQRPVSLLDLYPTLIDLAGLSAKDGLEGVSLRPLLEDPKAEWERPAVMTFERGNHAVRSERWRYIRYADGSEELYDHSRDPNEWRNAATGNEAVIEELRRWLPRRNAEAIPDMERK